MVEPDTLHDEHGCADQRCDLPVRPHTPATSHRPLPAQLAASTHKSCPGAGQCSSGGAKQLTVPVSLPLLLLAHRAALGTLVPRSVSGLCWTERCSPWPAPFPPRPPLKINPLCSTGSSVLWCGPTPPERACPTFGFAPSRTGLDP